jgi:hypothetical protein
MILFWIFLYSLKQYELNQETNFAKIIIYETNKYSKWEERNIIWEGLKEGIHNFNFQVFPAWTLTTDHYVVLMYSCSRPNLKIYFFTLDNSKCTCHINVLMNYINFIWCVKIVWNYVQIVRDLVPLSIWLRVQFMTHVYEENLVKRRELVLCVLQVFQRRLVIINDVGIFIPISW